MKTRIGMWVATGVMGLGAVAGAAPLDVRQVAEKSQWVVHVDAERLWTTDFGKLLKQELVTGEPKAKLEALNAIVGVDLCKDVLGVTLYGQETGKSRGVVLVAGNFAQERVLVLLRAAEGYSNRPYESYTIHHWIDKDARGNDPAGGHRWGTFRGEHLVVTASDEALVLAALDVLDGRKPGMKAGAKVGSYAVNAGDAVLFAAAVLPTPAAAGPGAPPNGNPQAMLLQNVQGLGLQLAEKEQTVHLGLTLAAKTPEIAGAVEQAIKGIQAIGILSGQKNPDLARLAQALKTSTAGADVTVDLALASPELFGMIKSKWLTPKPHRPPAPVPAENAGPAPEKSVAPAPAPAPAAK